MAVFDALPGIALVLAPDAPRDCTRYCTRYCTRAAPDGRLAATMTTREGTLGRLCFAVSFSRGWSWDGR